MMRDQNAKGERRASFRALVLELQGPVSKVEGWGRERERGWGGAQWGVGGVEDPRQQL